MNNAQEYSFQFHPWKFWLPEDLTGFPLWDRYLSCKLYYWSEIGFDSNKFPGPKIWKKIWNQYNCIERRNAWNIVLYIRWSEFGIFRDLDFLDIFHKLVRKFTLWWASKLHVPIMISNKTLEIVFIIWAETYETSDLIGYSGICHFIKECISGGWSFITVNWYLGRCLNMLEFC